MTRTEPSTTAGAVRRGRELDTIAAMIRMYCGAHHQPRAALVCEPTRLIHSHTDEYQDKDDPAAPPRAETTTDSIPLARLTVTVHQGIPGPAAYDPATTIAAEVQVTIDWSSHWRAEGGQDHCDDDNCQDFHGYLTLTGDDLTLQVSRAAHGPAAITSALTFAAALAASSAKPR